MLGEAVDGRRARARCWASALALILGQGAVQAVTQTINDLYFVVTVRGIGDPGGQPGQGRGLAGVMATVAAARLPAWEATAISPRQALTRSGLEETARRLVPLTALAGAIAIAIGGGLLAIPTRSPVISPSTGSGQGLAVSFAGIFFLTIGFALLAPVFTLLFLRGIVPLTYAVFGALGRMAPRGVSGALSRTAVAVAALMVAISVTIGVGLMVGSFRTTVISWLGQTLWGDLYVSAPSLTSTRSSAPARSERDRGGERLAWRGAVGRAAIGGRLIAGWAGGCGCRVR